MHANTKISVYDTDPDLYEVLARSLTEQISGDGKTRWVNFKTTEGVEFTFFATYYAEVADQDEPEPGEALDDDDEILAMEFPHRRST